MKANQLEKVIKGKSFNRERIKDGNDLRCLSTTIWRENKKKKTTNLEEADAASSEVKTNFNDSFYCPPFCF